MSESPLKHQVQELRKRVRRMRNPSDPMRVRRRIAAEYIRGEGIEIGALHQPLEIPRSARVRYVDRMHVPELKHHYSDLAQYKLVEVDIVDNGEVLSTIADNSVDFVIGNHLLEHCEDPLATIGAWLRVIRPGGVLFAAVPDKRFTFDRDRPVTPLEHLVRDHADGPAASRRQHFEEWARLVEKCPDDRVGAMADDLIARDYSIHYHVWTDREILDMLGYCRDALGYPFEVALFRRNGFESVMVLRKNSVESA